MYRTTIPTTPRAILRWAFVLVLASIGGCDDRPPGVEFGAAYSSCSSDADCDSIAPHCQVFHLHERSASWCTPTCINNDDCPSRAVSAAITSYAVCEGISDSGMLDRSASTKVCVYRCISGNDDCPIEGQSCVDALDPSSESLTVCAE